MGRRYVFHFNLRQMVHLQVSLGMDSSREVDIQEINSGEKEMFGSDTSQWVIMVSKSLHIIYNHKDVLTSKVS